MIRILKTKYDLEKIKNNVLRFIKNLILDNYGVAYLDSKRFKNEATVLLKKNFGNRKIYVNNITHEASFVEDEQSFSVGNIKLWTSLINSKDDTWMISVISSCAIAFYKNCKNIECNLDKKNQNIVITKVNLMGKNKLDYYAEIIAEKFIDNDCNEITKNGLIMINEKALALRDDLWDWLVSDLGFSPIVDFVWDSKGIESLVKSIRLYIKEHNEIKEDETID